MRYHQGVAVRTPRVLLLSLSLSLALPLASAPVPLAGGGPGEAQAAPRGAARGDKRRDKTVDKRRGKPRTRPAPRPAEPGRTPRAAEPVNDQVAGPAAVGGAGAEAPTSTAAAEGGASAGAGAARPGRPRVYTFGGLDLEGKLKTPQLLYFRGRMRQELDASSQQKRSFMKELEKSADDPGL